MTDPKLRRRYVYMSDAEWEWLKEQAHRSQVTISSLLRGSIAWVGHNPAELGSANLTAMVLEDALPDPTFDDWEHAAPTLAPPRPAPKPAPRKRR